MSDMSQEYASTIFFVQMIIFQVKTLEFPIYNLQHVDHKPYPPLTSLERINKQYCFLNKKWKECSAVYNYNVMNTFTKRNTDEKIVPYQNPYMTIREFTSNVKSFFDDAFRVQRRPHISHPPGIINIRTLPNFHGKLPATSYQHLHPGYPNPNYLDQISKPNIRQNFNNPSSIPHIHPPAASELNTPAQHSALVNSSNNVYLSQLPLKPSAAIGVSTVAQKAINKNMSSIDKFTQSLDHFERQFYMITFTKLTTISPADRQENGMSFVQSGFFLLLTLMAISTEVDLKTRAEIDRCIGFRVSDTDSIGIIRHFMTSLPDSSDKLKLQRSSRLMLWPGRGISQRFRTGAAAALKLRIDRFNGTETTAKIATILNRKVEMDSGGAIHDTFDEDDVAGGVTAVLVTTIYVRGCWRTAPTVLNGTRLFRDADNAPKRTVRMIRINDVMRYANLNEWDAQALEISYATPGLSLLMLIPRHNSLRGLVNHIKNTSIGNITAKMKTMRVAATVPLYTLRMTLLLPNKLQAMGIQSLVDVGNITQASSLKLSHAVQRIMFWAEAGRNAYKDDGIEWDQTPDLEVVVDRPYIFFVRWRNVTLIDGNFVL